jgi:hypothetical protein
VPKTHWQLATGERVFDRSPSHIHPGVRPFLKGILARINSRRRHAIVEVVEHSHLVGHSSCVTTRPGDKIVFARRVNRRGISRFVKNRRSEPTQFVTVILRRTERGDYQLKTAYFGEPAPREPWGDSSASRTSRDFWRRHAFAWGTESIVRGSETYRPPVYR